MTEEPVPSLRLKEQSMEKIRFARKLRRRMTEAEQVIWEAIRNRKNGCKYRRQVPLGPYIADFCCMTHRIIFEIDGSIHTELKEKDAMRDALLKSGQFTVIRFSNEEVMERLPIVLESMRKACGR